MFPALELIKAVHYKRIIPYHYIYNKYSFMHPIFDTNLSVSLVCYSYLRLSELMICLQCLEVERIHLYAQI